MRQYFSKIFSFIVRKPDPFARSLVLVITFITFFPTFSNDFQTSWDDQWAIIENPFVLSPTVENWKILFTNFYYGQYAPLNAIFYLGLFKIFGFNAIVFHSVCLLFHLSNILLVFSISKKIVAQIKLGYSPEKILLYSFFISLIFGIHPLQVESVAWISASKVVIYSFFYLLGICCYLIYIERNKKRYLCALILLYLISLGLKEQAIILPISLLAIDYLYHKLPVLNLSIMTNRIFLEKLPLIAIALAYWYFSASSNVGSLTLTEMYPLNQRCFLAAQSLTEYIFRFIAPVKLFFFYYFPFDVGENLPLSHWRYFLLVLIIVSFIWINYYNNNRLLVFGFCFFLINIFLVLHIIPVPRGFVTADRYMYLALIGLAFMLVWLIHYVYVRYKFSKIFLIMFLFFYCSFLSVKSFSRTKEWKNSESLKSNIRELRNSSDKVCQFIASNGVLGNHWSCLGANI